MIIICKKWLIHAIKMLIPDIKMILLINVLYITSSLTLEGRDVHVPDIHEQHHLPPGGGETLGT